MQWLLTIGLLVAGSHGLAPILAQYSSSRIPGSWLVQFKVNTPLDVRQGHMKRMPAGAAVQTEWDFETFQGYHIKCEEAECDRVLGQLREETSILHIEADQIYTADAAPNQTQACACQTGATWGLARVGRRTRLPSRTGYPHDNNGGSGVKVCILDTGIRTNLGEFGGRAQWGANYAGGANTDNHGHGTHVAGTVASNTYGIAKKATVVAVKVLNDNGSGSSAGIVSGCQYASNNCGVSNLSLGGGASSTLDNAVNAMRGQVAVAAGNCASNACNYSPARATGAITVGSTTSTDGVSSFSNYGNCLNGWAPGSNIESVGLNGGRATMSGTSMAAPHVAGALAVSGQWLPNIISRSGSPSNFIYTPQCPDAC